MIDAGYSEDPQDLGAKMISHDDNHVYLEIQPYCKNAMLYQVLRNINEKLGAGKYVDIVGGTCPTVGVFGYLLGGG